MRTNRINAPTFTAQRKHPSFWTLLRWTQMSRTLLFARFLTLLSWTQMLPALLIACDAFCCCRAGKAPRYPGSFSLYRSTPTHQVAHLPPSHHFMSYPPSPLARQHVQCHLLTPPTPACLMYPCHHSRRIRLLSPPPTHRVHCPPHLQPP